MSNISRRNLLIGAASAVGTGLVTVGLGKDLLSPEPVIAQNNVTPDQAIKQLMAGNDRFIKQKRKYPHQTIARLKEVAKGQNPYAAILGCADSRVPLEIVFDQGLGDLFVVRVAGNIVTPEETGSLEFGTLVLGAKVIMVLAHSECGAVKSTIQGGSVPGQIGSLLEAIKPAVDKTEGKKGDRLINATKQNVLEQIEKLKASPVISQLITDGKLKVIGGYYDLKTGKVSMVS
ncbi:MAG TPA: carbonic anhydrase [Allocoleopsis sp.]